ncbi:MAG: hypothetical protein WCC17_13900 [Candidatus Nitrosopolaris sp.]
MREVIAAIGLIFLVLIPGSAFAYWVPDSYGQEIGQRVPGPQGGNLGDNPGPSLPWLGIFGNPGYPYPPVYGGYPGYNHPGTDTVTHFKKKSYGSYFYAYFVSY